MDGVDRVARFFRDLSDRGVGWIFVFIKHPCSRLNDPTIAAHMRLNAELSNQNQAFNRFVPDQNRTGVAGAVDLALYGITHRTGEGLVSVGDAINVDKGGQKPLFRQDFHFAGFVAWHWFFPTFIVGIQRCAYCAKALMDA